MFIYLFISILYIYKWNWMRHFPLPWVAEATKRSYTYWFHMLRFRQYPNQPVEAAQRSGQQSSLATLLKCWGDGWFCEALKVVEIATNCKLNPLWSMKNGKPWTRNHITEFSIFGLDAPCEKAIYITGNIHDLWLVQVSTIFSKFQLPNHSWMIFVRKGNP